MEQYYIKLATDYLYSLTKLWIRENNKRCTIDKIVIKGIRTKSDWMGICPEFPSSMIIIQDRFSSVKMKLRGHDVYKWWGKRNE